MQNEDACPYLEVVDPEYPQRARDVIDELAAEVAELRENATIARHEFHIMQEDDRVVDREVRDIEEVEAVVLLGCCHKCIAAHFPPFTAEYVRYICYY